ncbi:MAG: hypothetical protein JNL49_01660 [Bacteroidia bacterium]|nr:hypothetical protein [Bacteroidia bacterium]
MKGYLFYLGIIVVFAINLNVTCGHGLDSIYVERYYVSDSTDKLLSTPDALPVGSVTYRIFVCMKPGYKLQAVYGSEYHQMTIGSSKQIYNHPNYGNYIPNLIPDYSLRYNTVMLDSWISMGAASMDGFGILKNHDDTASTVENRFTPPMLHNTNEGIGFPLFERDGIRFNSGKPPRVTAIGLDSLLADMNKFVAGTDSTGYYFKTNNGAWACLEGAKNVDGTPNNVVIAQFTTSGDLHFEFNIQLGTPEGQVERFVHSNPDANEILFPALKFNSNNQ